MPALSQNGKRRHAVLAALLFKLSLSLKWACRKVRSTSFLEGSLDPEKFSTVHPTSHTFVFDRVVAMNLYGNQYTLGLANGTSASASPASRGRPRGIKVLNTEDNTVRVTGRLKIINKPYLKTWIAYLDGRKYTKASLRPKGLVKPRVPEVVRAHWGFP